MRHFTLRTFVAELRRRRVLHTAFWYSGACVAVLEGANLILPTLGFSTAILRPLTLLAIFAFPVVLMLSWEYDVYIAAGASKRWRWQWILPVVIVGAVSTSAGWAVWNIRYASAPVDTVVLADPAHVVVLPFEASSMDPELVDFASTLQGFLIGGLSDAASTVPEGRRLRVVSEKALEPYESMPLDSIRRFLQAGTALSGSVEAAGSALRVRIGFIDTESGDQIATRVVERGAANRLAIVDEVRDSVLRMVRHELGEVVRNRVRRLETRSNEAFNYFVAAMRRIEDSDAIARDTTAWHKALADAEDFLIRAEQLDPNWIEPIVQRGYIARIRVIYENRWATDSAAALIRTGLAHADRALRLKPGDFRALELRGLMLFTQLQSQRGATPADRAILAAAAEHNLLQAAMDNPNPANCYRLLGELAWSTGRFEEAVKYSERAYKEDPYYDAPRATLLRRFEYAIALGRDSLARHACIEGRRRFAYVVFDDCRLQLAAWTSYGMTTDSARMVAQRELESYEGIPPRGLEARVAAMYAAVLIRNDMRDSARIVLANARHHDTGTIGFMKAAAGVYMLLGHQDSAMIVVQRLLALLPSERGVLKVTPELRALRSNPEFLRLTVLVD